MIQLQVQRGLMFFGGGERREPAMEILITMKWDEEASVWIAHKEGSGFILEDESYDRLVERVVNAVPDIMEICGIDRCDSIRFVTEERAIFIKS